MFRLWHLTYTFTIFVERKHLRNKGRDITVIPLFFWSKMLSKQSQMIHFLVPKDACMSGFLRRGHDGHEQETSSRQMKNVLQHHCLLVTYMTFCFGQWNPLSKFCLIMTFPTWPTTLQSTIKFYLPPPGDSTPLNITSFLWVLLCSRRLAHLSMKLCFSKFCNCHFLLDENIRGFKKGHYLYLRQPNNMCNYICAQLEKEIDLSFRFCHWY